MREAAAERDSRHKSNRWKRRMVKKVNRSGLGTEGVPKTLNIAYTDDGNTTVGEYGSQQIV